MSWVHPDPIPQSVTPLNPPLPCPALPRNCFEGGTCAPDLAKCRAGRGQRLNRLLAATMSLAYCPCADSADNTRPERRPAGQTIPATDAQAQRSLRNSHPGKERQPESPPRPDPKAPAVTSQLHRPGAEAGTPGCRNVPGEMLRAAAGVKQQRPGPIGKPHNTAHRHPTRARVK